MVKVEDLEIGRLLLLLEHPRYGRVLYEIINIDGDEVELEVISDDGIGLRNDEDYRLPNVRIGMKVKTTKLKLVDELNGSNEFNLIPRGQEDDFRRRVDEGQRY